MRTFVPRHLCVFAVITLLGVAAAARAGEALLSEVRRAIDQGNAEYTAACAKRDATAFAAIFAPDGARLEHGGQLIEGRSAIEKATASAWANLTGALVVTTDTADVWLIDNLAYESGAYTFTFSATSAGEAKRISGHYLTVWKKQPDGRWRIYRDLDVARDGRTP